MAFCKSLSILLALSCAVVEVLAQGQPYPIKPVVIIVPTTAGTSADRSARFVAEKLTAEMGQSFVVDNKPGADGVIAASAVKSAQADGYLLLLGSTGPISVNPVVKRSLPYDPLVDFRPIHGVAQGINVFVTSPDSGLRNLADVVKAFNQSKTPINAGSSLASYALSIARLESLADIKFNIVSYRGTPQVLNDVLGKQLPLALVDIGSATPLLKAGKIRAVAVGGESRHVELPEVPTVKESGYGEYVSRAWVALMVRAETPMDIVNKLSAAMKKIAASEDLDAFLRKSNLEVWKADAQQVQTAISSEIASNRRAVEAAGIQPE